MSKYFSSMAKRAAPYIPGEQLNEPDIIKLNTNENPYPPSPHVLEAIKAEVSSNLRLYPTPTMDRLKQEAADYYGVEPKNVFIGNGSDEVLAFSFMAFFEPGEEIFFPAITYSFYPVYAALYDIPYKTVPLREDFTIRPESFFHAPGGVIFPNPNAPTSVYLPLEAIEEILQHNQDKVVIVDEAYIDFAPDSAVALTKKYDNLLIIQTMSKSRALAGLRIGLAIGNEQLIQGLVRMKDSFNSYPVDRLALAGAAASIQDDAYFQETTKKIIQTREWVTASLQKRQFQVLPSAANFVFASHAHVPAVEIYEKLRAAHVLIRYFGKEPIDNYVRISIGTDEEMENMLAILDDIV